MFGKRSSCLSCGYDINPPLNPDILNADGSLKKGMKGANPPSTGKDNYTSKEIKEMRQREYVRM